MPVSYHVSFVLFYVFLCCVVLCMVCVYSCTELLPPGDYPIAVKYITSCHISWHNWILYACRDTSYISVKTKQV